MPTDSNEQQAQLLSNDDEFRQLAAKHQELEQRLRELAEKHYLSEPEQLEEVTLKKRKLQLKDRMEDIRRHHRSVMTGMAAPSAPLASPIPRS